MKNAGMAHWKGSAIAVALVMITSTSLEADQSKFEKGKPIAAPKLKVHEWGTFTTLHGPAGNGLAWYQDTAGKVSELPSFVHSQRYGLKSRSRGVSTARMETPVLYFYTDQKQTVDVSVNYQGGVFTEFYPQKWQGLELIPPSERGDLLKQLPIDPARPDNHYYEARAVPDAAIVRSVRGPDKDGKPQADEIEKFVFYRGVGTFDTRLRPALSSDGKLNLSYYHTEVGLKHVWVLQSSADAVRWTKLDPFLKWNTKERVSPVPIQLSKMKSHGSREESVAGLVDSMVAALIDAGLTNAEASAMVATWDEQWYNEPGQRVFTIPAQSLINEVLPLTISPKPSEVVRVFVHRQEMLSPETMGKLEFSMKPDTKPQEAREVISKEELGRFVHGALDAVAEVVATRTRTQYYARGLEAIAPLSTKAPSKEKAKVLALQK